MPRLGHPPPTAPASCKGQNYSKMAVVDTANATPVTAAADVEAATPYKLFVGQVRRLARPFFYWRCPQQGFQRRCWGTQQTSNFFSRGAHMIPAARAVCSAPMRRPPLTAPPHFGGQVPVHFTADQLKPNFEPFGNIEEVTIIYDKMTHLSKGAPAALSLTATNAPGFSSATPLLGEPDL